MFSAKVKERLEIAFQFNGYALGVKEDHLIVEKSENAQRAKCAEIVEMVLFCPVLSDERHEGKIAFTITPYRVPPFIKIAPMEERAWLLIREQVPFWQMRGSEAVRNNAWINEMTSSQLTERFMRIVDGLKPGRALDLGCGSGEKTKYLLQKGWSVDAVDSCPQLSEQLPKLKCYQMEAEAFPFPQKYDLIVVYGILCYIDPEQFPALWEKLHHALNDGGRIVGTFLKMVKNPNLIEKFSGLGTWYVEDKRHVLTLLNARGYRDIECDHYQLSKDEVYSAEFEFSANKAKVLK